MQHETLKLNFKKEDEEFQKLISANNYKAISTSSTCRCILCANIDILKELNNISYSINKNIKNT